jgi:hypothetical protein
MKKKVDLLAAALNGQGGHVPVGAEAKEEVKDGLKKTPHKHGPRDQSP